jgi:FtsH-binding integral membrane protein
MAQEYRAPYGVGTGTAAEFDAGLRAHMLHVYNYMASGVLLTGILAYAFAHTPALLALVYQVNEAGRVSPTLLGWIAMFSPLALILVMQLGLNRLSLGALQASFWAFAGLMGVSLSSIFLQFTGESIARVFFITAASFGALSLYGYTTKRDLGPLGKFLFMGLIGILIASVVNIFLASSMMQFVISVLGVLIFAGLTAYDTQKVKELYYAGYGQDTTAKLSILGALTLYLDFINLFIMLLQLFGARRD